MTTRKNMNTSKPLKYHILDYSSVAIIISNISVGCNTKKQLASKKRKTLEPVPNGTLDKFLKRLRKQNYISITKTKIARRKKESYPYAINYDTFVNELLTDFLSEVMNTRTTVEGFKRFIDKRIKKLLTELEVYEKGKAQLQTESKLVEKKGNQTYLWPTPHNEEEISRVTRNLMKSDVSLSAYYSVNNELEQFEAFCNTFKGAELSNAERELLKEAFKGLLYFSIISTKKDRKLSHAILTLKDMIKKGKLHVFTTDKFDLREEGFQAIQKIPITPELPLLYKLHEYARRKDEIGYFTYEEHN